MAGKGVTRAQENKAIRQEALRDQLSNQGHLQHIVELHKELHDLATDLDPVQVQRLRAVLDSKHKLLDKYLPTEKPSEIVASVDGNIQISWND